MDDLREMTVEQLAGKARAAMRADGVGWQRYDGRKALDELLRRHFVMGRELADAKRPGPCSVCAGKPLSGGRKCICETSDYRDGSPFARTEVAEMHGLRLALFHAEAAIYKYP